MRFPVRALVLLALASFGSSRALAALTPIVISGNPPSITVSAGEIGIGSSDAAAVTARAVNTTRAVVATDTAAGSAIGGLADSGAIGAIIDDAVVSGPAGALGIETTEAVTGAGAAEAILACAASIVCAGAAVTVGAVALAVHAYCKDGKCQLDNGTPAPVTQVWRTDEDPPNYGPSAGAACASFYSHLGAGTTPRPDVAPGSGRCSYQGDDGNWGAGPSVSQTSQKQCSPVNGVTPPGWDDGNGNLVCPSYGANVNPDPQALIDATSKYVKANPSTGMQGVTEAVAGGNGVSVIPYATSGPATQQGSTTTTTQTAADGTVTATTVGTSYGYTYAPAAIGVETSTTTSTTVTNPDGTTSTTTDTKTSGGTGTGTGSSGTGTGTGTGTTTGTGTSTDTPDLCALHPDVLACDTLGTPGTDGPQWSQQTVTFSPEDLGLPSGCPAPRTITVRGISMVLNYQPACDVAPLVAPGFIAFTALGCLLWIMSTIKA